MKIRQIINLLLVFVMVFPSIAFAQLATATVSSTPTVQIPPTFMGLAMQWGSSNAVIGQSSTGTNTILQQLIKNLTGTGQILYIRIGGSSTDSQNTPRSVTEFSQLYSATGVNVVFSLGVAAQTATVVQAQAQAVAYLGGMPSGSVLAIEIGNEPDYYSETPTQYYAQLASWISSIQSATGSSSLRFSAPSCSGGLPGITTCSTWSIPGILTANASALADFSAHYYVSGTSLTSGQLLAAGSYVGSGLVYPSLLSSVSLGVPYRLDEMNTSSSGGTSGVSNAFESALWILVNAFQYAAEGVSGINVSGNYNTAYPDYYSPFVCTVTAGTPNTFACSTNPIYYGILAFQTATANSSKIYAASVTAGTSSLVNVFDTGSASSVEQMVIVNRDTANSGNVNVTPRGTYSRANVCDVVATSYSSTTGVTICGQSVGSTGALTGTYTTTSVTPSAGVFSIPLTTADAKIVTFVP